MCYPTPAMPLADYAELLGPDLFRAIERKGYADLTAVQQAVLDPALAGRDLRVTSQTGSGKTLAIGLSLRGLAGQETPANGATALPRALIVAPTRELAHQVEQELTWLYADSRILLATTTGGASYRDERRAFAKGPAIVVGTPGRLLDHLQRGSIDASQVATVVLDEADRMLDLGFREDLEQLFKIVPTERATHLVSATFPRMVRSLADRLQRQPAHVQGTQLGAANADIDHVIHVVDSSQRLDALINLMLANPEDQTLVFVRTRADAAHIANELVVTGFAASALSGEMEQAARNRALAAFREGRLRVLIATDVAARGIDVQGVSRVVHGELPTNADAYTHRAGRTGRAGRKGTSSLLVAPVGVVRASRLLRGLGIQHRFEAIPTAEEILQAADEHLFEELTADPANADEAANEDADATLEASERWGALAKRLIEADDVERALVRLLKRAGAGVTAPRKVRVFPERNRRDDERPAQFEKRRDRDPRRSRDREAPRAKSRNDYAGARERPGNFERGERNEARSTATRASDAVSSRSTDAPVEDARVSSDQSIQDLVDAYRTERRARSDAQARETRNDANARPARERDRSDAGERRDAPNQLPSEPGARLPDEARDGGDEDELEQQPELSEDAQARPSRERAFAGDKARGTENRSRSDAYAPPARERTRDARNTADVESGDTRARAPRERARGDSSEARGPNRGSKSARDSNREERAASAGEFTSFHVSWGQRDGADARRLLAMLCRRGQIRGRDVGAIRVESNHSLVQVANAVVPSFARSASRPDPREPSIIIRLDRAQSSEDLSATKAKLRAANPFQRRGPSKPRPSGHRPPKRKLKR